MSIKSILVSQPKPEGDKSPYYDLAEKHKLNIDFRPFIQVEGLNSQEFRLQRIQLNEFTAIILTSKTAVDHYFRMAEETRFTVPDTMKYFCVSEAIAYYLQKYVQYRKRKIFFGKQTIQDLADLFKKHKNERYLLPSSDILREQIPVDLDKMKISFVRANMYKTVAADLSDLDEVKYDMLVFFSPSGIESLLKNFPNFKQEKTKIAAFGATTAKAVIDNNLRLDLHAPQPETPSMTAAIEKYINEDKKKK